MDGPTGQRKIEGEGQAAASSMNVRRIKAVRIHIDQRPSPKVQRSSDDVEVACGSVDPLRFIQALVDDLSEPEFRAKLQITVIVWESERDVKRGSCGRSGDDSQGKQKQQRRE